MTKRTAPPPMLAPDPYEGMTDEEFYDAIETEAQEADAAAGLQRVAFLAPASLIGRARRTAEQRRVPYGQLLREIVAAGLDRLEGDSERK